MALLSGFAFSQAPVPVQPPANRAPAAGQLTPQMLGEMLQSAATFHELVQNLNLKSALGPDQHVIDADGREHHSMERTVQTIGAGAGAGAAIGAMSHSQNGMMIGALVGAGAGIILDQILREHEQQRLRAEAVPPAYAAPNVAPPNYVPPPPAREFRTRDADPDRRMY
jgi:hypothetical protein